MLINLLKFPIPQLGERGGKVIRSRYLGSESTHKVNHFFRLVGTIMTPSFKEIGALLLQ